MKVLKTNEKILLWLFRENKSQVWLAEQLGLTRQAISNKLKGNNFSDVEMTKIRALGYNQ